MAETEIFHNEIEMAVVAPQFYGASEEAQALIGRQRVLRNTPWGYFFPEEPIISVQ